MTGLTPLAQRAQLKRAYDNTTACQLRPRAAKGVQLFLWMGGEL